MSWRIPTMLLIGTALMCSAACDRGDSNRSAKDERAPATASSPANAPVVLTGCLQRVPGLTEYVLTEANRPGESVGTSGSAPSDKGATDQLSTAERSYRLSGDTDTFKELEGKRVRISGTITKEADLSNRTPQKNEEAQRSDEKSRADIKDSDFGKVDVTSIDKVSDSCGTDNPARR